MEVNEFFLSFEGAQKEVLLFLHHELQHVNLISKIRFKVPFYYQKSWICYLHPLKKGGVELAFTRGNELSNTQRLLDSKGRKQVYSVEFNTIEEIPLETLHEVIYEALLLDKTVPYASKRTKLS